MGKGFWIGFAIVLLITGIEMWYAITDGRDWVVIVGGLLAILLSCIAGVIAANYDVDHEAK